MADLAAALHRRLDVVARELGVGEGADALELLGALLERCRASDDVAELWLTMVAATARWPTGPEVRALRRRLRSDPVHAVVVTLLASVVADARAGTPELDLDLVTEGVVVVVDATARNDYSSGIQRTVRRTLPRWRRDDHRFVATAYTRTSDGLRGLRAPELQRVLDDQPTEPTAGADEEVRLVVPWRSTVVLLEVPVGPVCRVLSGAAELSGSTVTGIGYDAIRLVSAQLRRWNDSELFVGHLSLVKHLATVAAISGSSALEFSGFTDMLGAQGLGGPRVVEVGLPAEPPASDSAGEPLLPHTPGRVQVLCVGAKETHKNHRAVLHAAERLWREGLGFDLTFVGNRGWTPETFEAAFDRLEAAGRPVRHLGRLSDEALAAAYREADLTVFLSLHEGYGLPVAESLSCGTPVLTTSYGSQAEIAAGGGALVADPRSDDDIAAQLRRLVTDGELRDRLAAEARARLERSWDDYAAELWDALAGGRR